MSSHKYKNSHVYTSVHQANYMSLFHCFYGSWLICELEQTVSWKGSFCPRLIPAFQLHMKNQWVKGELIFVCSLSDFLLPYMNTSFLPATLLFTEYFLWCITSFIPLKTLVLSEQPLLLATCSFEIQLEAGSSGAAYDKTSWYPKYLTCGSAAHICLLSLCDALSFPRVSFPLPFPIIKH